MASITTAAARRKFNLPAGEIDVLPSLGVQLGAKQGFGTNICSLRMKQDIIGAIWDHF